MKLKIMVGLASLLWALTLLGCSSQTAGSNALTAAMIAQTIAQALSPTPFLYPPNTICTVTDKDTGEVTCY